MKKNKLALRTTLVIAILFTTACETGMKNKNNETMEAPSGIVDKVDYFHSNSIDSGGAIQKISIRRIFSKSATPGYYLQAGFFKNYKPNATFMNRIKHAGMPYTILLKNGNYHALIGPYTSYNQAKAKRSKVPASLSEQPFVIQVMRP